MKKSTPGNPRKKGSKNKVTVYTLRHPLRLVAGMYAVFSVLRAVLACLMMNFPHMWVDESLYINLAQSFSASGSFLFRGQPVNTPFVLYPVLLTPVYFLHRVLPFDLYHGLLIENCLLMTSCVFPAYLFAKECTGSETKGVMTAALTALMPDMMMVCYVMAESVIWPLSLWMLLFAFRAWQGKGRRSGIWAGLCTGLLFLAKPGAALPGAVLLFGLAVSRQTDKKTRREALAGLGVTLGAVLAMYGLFLLFAPEQFSVMALYEKQTKDFSAADILVALEALFGMPLLFVLAGAGVFVLWPVLLRKKYTAEQRRFCLWLSAGVLALMAGVAVFVTPYDRESTLGRIPLHLRYVSMYLPAFIALTLVPDLPRFKSKAIAAALAAVAVLAVFPGANIGFVPGDGTVIDSLALNAYQVSEGLRFDPRIWGTAHTALLAGGLVYMLCGMPEGWSPKHRRFAAVLLAVLMLFENGCFCAKTMQYGKLADGYLEDTREIAAYAENRTEECLGVMQRSYDDIYTRALDAALTRPMQQITAAQLAAEALPDGVYTPFVPLDQDPNRHNRLTPDTETLVLGYTVASQLELREGLETQTTRNGCFTVVHIDRGERWLDSLLYGMDKYTLSTETDAFIAVFADDRMRDGWMKLCFTASGKGSLLIEGTEIALSETPVRYEINLDYSAVDADAVSVYGMNARRIINIKAVGANANIYGYSLEKQN